ncbi:tyrosine-type recombinase/integrase [Paraburkholderia caballeronis]|uniref:tyrosine-type recombinase/integrase n=1 Tax=Paraburkholderia caballeronis TaxID=416943 RepID=UPI0010648482|nr:site-specific integrase [Paraburkholderia caballeronis]TDV17314.1 site-specific recombinase XerD [Paraburkholderia caballeronis]TDV17699.1 site-specific recombinase XerD [Paraburkholderia caballeronis]TDV27717.1 site-specific recombinase XerD [Paraburkholderia caballeronis]
MSIRKRKGSDIWHLDIRTPDGERIRQTTGTSNRKEAQEYHDKLKHELWRVAKMGDRPGRTWDEAGERMLKESEHLADHRNRMIHILHFHKVFAGRLLASITRDEIYGALPEIDQRCKQPRPVSRATKNKYLSTIRILLKLAHKWEWIDRAPSLEDLKVSNRRIRWITKDEARRLISVIRSDWMRDVAILGFATGLRRANLLTLEWSQVDLVNRRAWIHPDQAKARKPIGVPLNDDAVEAIRRWIGCHERFVFIRNGNPIPADGWNSSQWDRQCALAGIENFRFHDVRHTWASWHVQAGTPLNRLMELGGWAKYEHVLRYAHLAPDHLAEHANAVTIWAQSDTRQAVSLAA